MYIRAHSVLHSPRVGDEVLILRLSMDDEMRQEFIKHFGPIPQGEELKLRLHRVGRDHLRVIASQEGEPGTSFWVTGKRLWQLDQSTTDARAEEADPRLVVQRFKVADATATFNDSAFGKSVDVRYKEVPKFTPPHRWVRRMSDKARRKISMAKSKQYQARRNRDRLREDAAVAATLNAGRAAEREIVQEKAAQPGLAPVNGGGVREKVRSALDILNAARQKFGDKLVITEVDGKLVSRIRGVDNLPE